MSKELSFEDRVNGALNLLGSKVSELRFDELISYATDACLKNEPDYNYKEDALTNEQKLVNILGVRGIKAAAELSYGHTLYTSWSPTDEPQSDSVRIDVSLPVTYPWLISDSISREALYKSERFGEGLLEEAYKVLGQDVYEKIASLRAATTPEEQIEVIEWLDSRIRKMTSSENTIDASESDSDEDRYFYHPARISPKIIGVFPEHALRPTCLSVSIIGSSFLQKAGVPTMHAAVNESSIDKATGNAIKLIEKIVSKYESKLSIPFSDMSLEAMQSVLAAARVSYTAEEAQHAAVYAKLSDGTWMQFDPNYYSTTDINPDFKNVNETLSDIHTQLRSLQEVAPGTEISTVLTSQVDLSEVLRLLLDSKKEEDLKLVREKCEHALANLPDEAILASLFDECIEPFFSGFDTINSDELIQQVNKIFAENGPAKMLEDTYYDMFNKYVLWGNSLETFTKRLKTDTSYLEKRIADMTALPFMMSVALAKKVAEESGGDVIHRKVELGLPASRIGMAALNDFAVYSEDDISLGFWLSHWSGSTSVTQHYDKEPSNALEAQLQYVNIAHYLTHPFTSKRNSEIIETFLEQHPLSHTDTKEKTDGHQQEGP